MKTRLSAYITREELIQFVRERRPPNTVPGNAAIEVLTDGDYIGLDASEAEPLRVSWEELEPLS